LNFAGAEQGFRATPSTQARSPVQTSALSDP
jgi:hypothetical protein